MDILVVLVLLCTCYAVTRVILRAEQTRSPTPTHPQPVGANASGVTTGSGNQPDPVWDALDDLQLTRLLTNATPRTISE